jgi:hypothetical protein
MAAAAEVTGHVHKSRTVQHLRPFQRRRNGRRTPASHTSRPRYGCRQVQPRARLSWARLVNRLNMAQLAQLNGMNAAMNSFNMNIPPVFMASLSMMGISPEAQLLAARIAAAGRQI